MALENSDLLVVQRPGTSDLYKLAIGDLPAGDGGDSSVIISEDAPATPSAGQLWWCESDAVEGGGRLYIYTGSEWVDISQPGGESGEGGGASVTVSENAPVGATEGDLWYSNSTDLEFGGRLYIYIDGVWVDASLPGGGSGGGEGGSANISVGETPPSAEQGSLWWANNTVDDGGGRLYIYIDGQWVDTSLPGGAGGDGGFTEPVTFTQVTTHEAGANFGTQGTQPAPQSDATVTYYGDGVEPAPASKIDCYGSHQLRLKSDVESGADSAAASFLFQARNTDDKIAEYFMNPTGELRIHGYGSFVAPDFEPTNSEHKCLLGNGSVRFALSGRNLYNDTVAVYFGISDNSTAVINSPSDRYTFSALNYGANLDLVTKTDVFGMQTSVGTTAGQYGIHHSGSKTISLKNLNGEARLNGNGTFTANAFFMVPQSDLDNPANYDVDENYIGPKFDLREKIENVLTRISAIEANEIADDAIDTSLLQLIASASSRLDSIEARLTALEGGNN